MKEIPILFNAEMVRAILDGRKTQTRRPVKLEPCMVTQSGAAIMWPDATLGFPITHQQFVEHRSPFKAGDVLTISEAVTVSVVNDEVYSLLFAADGKYEERFGTPELIAKIRAYKRPQLRGVFLPPAFQRNVKLPVTDIRVQRVQEISKDDAMAEGVVKTNFWNPKELDGRPFEEKWWDDCEFWTRYPQVVFSKIWQSIYNTWDANPWVWAATFEVVK